MSRLILRTLRFRWGGFVASLVAMFLGALLIMAWGGLLETAVRSAVPPQRLAAAPLIVTGDQTYDLPGGGGTATLTERVRTGAQLVDTIRSLPTVARAVGDVSVPASLLRDGGVVQTTPPTEGHAWSSAELAPFSLTAGAPPGAGEVVLDDATARMSGFAVGDLVQVAAHGGAEGFRVSGTASSAGVTAQRVLFFADSDIARLTAAPGTVDAIAVLPKPGVGIGELERQVADALRGQAVVTLTGDERGLAEFPYVHGRTIGLQIVSFVFGAMVLAVALLGVAAPLTLAVQQRHRDVALLRAVGATPRQVRLMILGEATVLSILATLLAVLPSAWLSRWFFARLVDGSVAAAEMRFQRGWLPVFVTGAIALVAAVGSALIASRRAVSIRPTAALADSDVSQPRIGRLRIALAVLSFVSCSSLIVTTMAILKGPIAASTAGSATIMFVFGLALLGPVVMSRVIGLVSWPFRRAAGLSGRLAALNTRTRVARAGAVLTPIMLLTGVATADIYIGTTEVAMAETVYTENLRADAAITSPPGGFAPEVLAQVQATPGVAAASEFVASVGYVESPPDSMQTADGWQLQGVSADGADGTTPVGLTAGSLRELRGNSVALSDAHARELRRGIGDEVTLRLGDGATANLRVVAIFTAKATFERILLPADLLARHTTTGRPTQIMVRANPGVDRTALIAALAGLTAVTPATAVVDRGVLADSYSEGFNTQVLASYLVVGVVIAYGALAAVNAVVTATVRRRREFALQRLTGFTRSQVLRMTMSEGVIISLTGVLLGTFAGLVGLVPFLIARFETVVPRGPAWIYLAIAGLTVVLTVSAMVVPSWLALRSKPIEAARVG